MNSDRDEYSPDPDEEVSDAELDSATGGSIINDLQLQPGDSGASPSASDLLG